jgi:16S rRNA (guanine527-N7)-methyltransferase
MTIAELGAICEANGLPLGNDQLAKLDAYATLLRAKNQVVNLISRKDEENIFAKHILHSLALVLPHAALAGIGEGAQVFDLGSGGGLPGIPITIARPDIRMTLSDSIAKKIAAVSEIVKALELQVHTLADRAENIAIKKEHKNNYDMVITRAVAPLDELMKWSHGLVKSGGILLALKGGDIQEEMAKAKKLKFVASIEEAPLALQGYEEFTKEEKKIVRAKLV